MSGHGTALLARLVLRRDRLRLAAWVGVAALVSGLTAVGIARIFPTPQARALVGSGLAQTPAALALIGPAFDVTTVGGLTAWRLGVLGSSLVALMSLLSVVRHSRAEEDSGRGELLASTAVGRHAMLSSALLVTGGANLAVAALVAAALVAAGLPPLGAVAMGLSLCAAGLVFAAIAAVTAQLAGSARGAAGLAGAILGAAVIARAVGDASRGGSLAALSWVSPIGWAQRVRPFAGERFAVLGLSLAVAAALTACAYGLAARRDLGAGLLSADGRGRPERSPRGAFGLAWRLQRSTLVAWTVAVAIAAAAMGGMARGAAELIGGSVRLRLMVAALGGAAGLVDAYLAAVVHMLGMVISACAVQAVLRLRAEEDAGLAETVLATSLGRIRWAASHLLFALAGPAVVLAVAGGVIGSIHGYATDGLARELPRMLAAALVQLPAVWVLAAVGLALYGVDRRLAPVSWAVLGACVLLEQLGGILQIPGAMSVSPFAHLPRLPAATVAVGPLAALCAVAAALVAVGLVGLRRRDLG